MNRRIRSFIVRCTYDKKLFNCTLLRYYRCLKAAAGALDNKKWCKKEKKC